MEPNILKSKSIDSYLDAIRLALQRRRGGRVALLCLAVFSLLLLSGLWYLYRSDFSAGTVLALRLLFVLTLVASVIAILSLWRKRIAPLRVARYLEEKNPQLQQRLITAVHQQQDRSNPFWPMLERDTLRSAQTIRLQPALQAQKPWLLSALAATALTIAVLLIGPSFFRYGLQKLLALSQAKRPLYEISVRPGNAKIAPGMDQEIQARPVGFDTTQVSLFFKFQNQPQWERVPMERSSAGRDTTTDGVDFGYLIMDIREAVSYYVEAEKIRSPEFRIDVADWPRVEKITLHYFYPAYTGLKPLKVENQGDIQAIRGTRVRVQVLFSTTPQKPQLFLERKGETVALSVQEDKSYVGELAVQDDDQYWVRTVTPQGEVRSSQPYEIVALDDQSPVIRFNRPGRDQKVSKLEEVPTELEAEDDFGLQSVQLNYSVNGGKEQSISLFGPGNAREVKKDHTFYLEEMNVQPGDFVAYYGLARDAVSTAKTDIYFLEVKPFDREFYQNQQRGQGGGGQQEDPVLSRRQKEIIAGTWKILQEDRKRSRERKSEDFRTLALVQQRLQQQAESIVERLKRRGGALSDATARQMIESLQQAAELMGPAHQNLSGEQAGSALSFEQQALQKLLRAEALMKEVQVSWGANGGGGGGSSSAEELADLFELERDQMKNQYETLQQSQPGQRQDPRADEALQKLKELARRQQQNLQQDFNAAQQRRLQQETEELARQLERLSRQRQNPQMEEIARQLQEASRNMQGSMQGQGDPRQSSRALDQLRRAESQLSQMRERQRREQFSQLNQAAENLVRQQQGVEDQVSNIQQRSQQRGGVTGRDIRRLLEEKEEVRQGLRSLERDLDEAAKDTAAGQRKASQDLKSAANEIRDRRLEDKVMQGSSLIQRGLIDQARQREQSLTQEFRNLQNQIAQAQQNAEGSQGAGDDRASQMQRALEDAGRLLDQLEQMQRARQQSGQQGSQQPGQQASSRQPGTRQEGDRQGGERQGGERQRGERQGENPQSPGQQQSEDTGNQQGQGNSQSSAAQQQSGSNAGGQQAQSGSQPQGSRQQSGNSPQGGPRQGPRTPSPADNQEGVAEAAGALPGRPGGGFRRRDGLPENEQEWSRFWDDRLRDAQQIRRSLEGEREMTRQVDQIMERMRQMDANRALNLPGLEDLQSSIIQGFRALELKLSLRLQEKKENLQLFNQEDVPLEYRKAVEEYYRSLARSKAKE